MFRHAIWSILFVALTAGPICCAGSEDSAGGGNAAAPDSESEKPGQDATDGDLEDPEPNSEDVRENDGDDTRSVSVDGAADTGATGQSDTRDLQELDASDTGFGSSDDATTSVDANGESGADVSGSEDSTTDATSADGSDPAIQSCEAIGAKKCFSNNACEEGQRCENVGTSSVPVACCVAGERGDKEAGEPCTETAGETECKSSVCISGPGGSFCSRICESKEDCPPNMQDCRAVMFSESEHKWCFPTQN